MSEAREIVVVVGRKRAWSDAFSIIEEGEVEALKATEQNAKPQIVAVLSKGDSFGEAMLTGNRQHETSVRARTAVRLTQIGSDLFSQLAGASAPLREVLSRTLTRRSGDFWRRLPLAKSLLADEPMASLLDPLPAKFLSKETTLADAVIALNESVSGELLILDEKQQLWGTLDRNDLYGIIARIAVMPAEKRGDVTWRKLSELLVGNPIYVSLDDSILAATATMLDHGTSWLPVVQTEGDLRPVGCLRGEKNWQRHDSEARCSETNAARCRLN
jgi:CRP-like cAMP-binding protein